MPRDTLEPQATNDQMMNAHEEDENQQQQLGHSDNLLTEPNVSNRLLNYSKAQQKSSD